MAVEATAVPVSGRRADSDLLGDAFYPLYRRLFDEDDPFVTDVEGKLAESRMTATVELYLSRALAVGVLAGVLLWAVGLAVGYALFATGLVQVGALLGMPVANPAVLAFIQAVKIPALVLVTGLVFGAVGFTAGFGTLVAIPYSRSASRQREIDMLLSDAVSYMYSLSMGGLNQVEILEEMAAAEDTYGEVAREFQTIVQETEYFDTDYRTAIRRQAMVSPSGELSQFLTDMLSIINSGGDMTAFLDDKKDKHMRTAKRQQERILETLELFGELYMTLSLLPLLLIIILVIMALLGSGGPLMLYATVYGLIPLTGVGFLALIATVKWDEPGDGYIRGDVAEPATSPSVLRTGLFNRGLIESFADAGAIFERIRRREGTHDTLELLRQPHVFFRDHPTVTLAVTGPVTLVLVAVAIAVGSAPTSWDGVVARPVWSTFLYVYVPIYVVVVPYATFRLWNIRSRTAVLYNLSDNLRKLSSANDTGLSLLDSIRLVGETTPRKLADEFEVIYAKVQYGMSLKEALVSFNNAYHIPRLARTVRLISKAQEASNHITAVIRTAAQASENQDDIDNERRARTRMQVVVIIMTYLTLLAVMAILKSQFIDVMGGLSAQAADLPGSTFATGLRTNLLSLLFFHAVTIQAVLSGLISGYVQEADLLAGLKYVVALMTVALVVWSVVG